MWDLVGNPEDRFSHDAVYLCHTCVALPIQGMLRYRLYWSLFCLGEIIIDIIIFFNVVLCCMIMKMFRFVIFLELGFPLGYFGDVQRGSPDSYTFVRNHGGAKHLPVQI